MIRGATEHNLKNIDVEFPLGLFIVVTGVSGSGKSTLVNDILYRAAAKAVYGSRAEPGAHASIKGLDLIDKVIEIDQSPIGRTPRSNPATYTQVFTPIRDLYAMLPESRERGYKPGRFSFNVKGGRCEACQGDGLKRIEMNFLPGRLCHLRCVPRTALQSRNVAGEIQGPFHRGPAGIAGGRSAEAARKYSADQGQTGNAGATSAWDICTWGNPPPRFRAAKRSASSWRAN